MDREGLGSSPKPPPVEGGARWKELPPPPGDALPRAFGENLVPEIRQAAGPWPSKIYGPSFVPTVPGHPNTDSRRMTGGTWERGVVHPCTALPALS